MNLVHILPDKDAGVASVVRNLIKFKQVNIPSKILLLHNSNDEEKRRIKTFCKASLVIHIVYNGKWASQNHIESKIQQHLNEHSVVISHDGAYEINAVASYKFKIPLIYILHGNFNHYFNNLKTYKYNINGIIAVSEFLAAKANSILETDSIVAIKFPLQKIEIDKKYYDQCIRIIYAGSLIEDKGVLLFDKVIKNLDKNKLCYKFTIVGDGPLRPFLEKNFELNKSVELLGKLPNNEVIEIMSNHDILLLCSYTEGLPVSVVEGMKSGLVPICSDLKSGIPELVINGKTGYRVTIDDDLKFSEYIMNLSQNKALLYEMSKNCIEFANKYFDPLKQTSAYEKQIIKFVNEWNFTTPNKKSIIDRILHRIPIIFAHRIKSLFNYQ